MNRSSLTRIFPIVGITVISVAFFLFSYNSGYGYDALEYLVIGRSMADGVPLYAYLPSKSPGIYYFVKWLYQLGVDFDHASLTAVITVLYATTIVVTFLVARRWFSLRAAYAVALLTALAAPFMEMNFLQPTTLFYMCGLLAFHGLLRFEKSHNDWTLFSAGIALGFGIAIKSSTAFYGLAAGHFLIMLWTREKATFAWLCKRGLVLAAGVAIVLVALIAYYGLQGKARAFIDWTFLFPFAHYPSSTVYIAKAYTKLLWVNALILGCIPFLFSTRIRAAVFRRSPAVLALVFGTCANLALFKTQASHYFFPGAPFLFMFAVAVYEHKLESVQLSKRLLTLGGVIVVGLICVMVVSVVFYRPDAVRRLTAIKDFANEEQPVRDFIQSSAREDQYVLITGGALGSTWTYWISHRYPPPPFINADVKTIWMLRNQPKKVFDVLTDPKLALVQFELGQLKHPTMEDVFGNLPKDRAVMRDYLSHIQTRFEQLPEDVVPATFWRRSSYAVRTANAAIAVTQHSAN